MRYGHALITFMGLAALILGLAGCPLDPNGVLVTVTPPNAVVEVGQTIQLSAESSSVDDTDFAWDSSDESVAVVELTKSAAVVLRAVAPGTATITATADVSGAAGTAVISVPQELPQSGEGEGEGEGEIEIPASKLAPGLNVTINSVSIPGDLKPVVKFVAKDNKGNLIALSELTTLRFILGYLDSSSRPQYVSYTVNSSGQATTDGAQFTGASQDPGGTISYKFKSAIPAGYTASATHQLSGQVRRLYVVDGLTYTSNPVFTFRPNGLPVTTTREISATNVCNDCHTRLEFHGGSRREFQYCIMCHTPQTTDPDTGNTVDMKVMIHKIHMGEDLPSVRDGEPYQIIGYGGAVHDYSNVVFPQDVRHCTACHQGAPHAGNYLTRPGQAACGSCHDRIWFGNPDATPDGFENHPLDFDQPDDSECATCHKPTTGVAPILQAHATEVSKGPAIALEITDVIAVPTKDAGSAMITIDFTAADGNGNPIADIGAYGARVGALLAYPAPEFQFRASVNFVGTGVNPPLAGYVNQGGGAHSYTFKDPVPDNYGTYAVALQGRVTFTLGGTSYRRGTLSNGYTEFTLDGSDPEPRRAVVDNAACGKCHGEIRGHGGQRLGVEVCLMCHLPTLSEDGVTVNFKEMIHRIHTGEELNNSYFEFNEVRFPGNRRQCTICHIEDTYLLPLPEVAAPTLIENEDQSVTEILPIRAACTSCHDSLLSDIHTVLMTDTERGIETCEVCHGEGKSEAVDAIHRMAP